MEIENVAMSSEIIERIEITVMHQIAAPRNRTLERFGRN
jgi:hypothetical protein